MLNGIQEKGEEVGVHACSLEVLKLNVITRTAFLEGDLSVGGLKKGGDEVGGLLGEKNSLQAFPEPLLWGMVRDRAAENR